MIGIEEVFGGLDDAAGVMTVAASLEVQGCIPDINIPVYEIFYIHIITGEKTEFLADSIQEYNMLRQMNMYCGSVAITCNLLGIDLLTLAGFECVFTPNTGMNIFGKVNIELVGTLLKLVEAGQLGMITNVLTAAGIPIPDYMKEGTNMSIHMIENIIDLVTDALDILVNMLLDAIGQSCEAYGINFCGWDGLPEFYQMLMESGEMEMMADYRAKYEKLQRMMY